MILQLELFQIAGQYSVLLPFFAFSSTNLFQITGQYSVLLPDGRVQTVTYSVRPETGFVVSTFPFVSPIDPLNQLISCAYH